MAEKEELSSFKSPFGISATSFPRLYGRKRTIVSSRNRKKCQFLLEAPAAFSRAFATLLRGPATFSRAVATGSWLAYAPRHLPSFYLVLGIWIVRYSANGMLSARLCYFQLRFLCSPRVRSSQQASVLRHVNLRSRVLFNSYA